MNSGMVLRLLCCLAVFAVYLYHVIHKQNAINYLSMQIPKVSKDLKTIEEENVRLRFLIDSFESPDHLMQLVKSPAYSHLRHPSVQEVFNLAEGVALQVEERSEIKMFIPFKPHPVLAVGAHH